MESRTITIRVTDEQKKAIKVEAIKRGMTMADYVIGLAMKDIGKQK